MNTFKECPICGSQKIEKKTSTEIFTYKGKTIEVENYIVYYCNKCGEGTADSKSRKKAESILRHFKAITDTKIKLCNF